MQIFVSYRRSGITGGYVPEEQKKSKNRQFHSLKPKRTEKKLGLYRKRWGPSDVTQFK
jgi:hypothetical protein